MTWEELLTQLTAAVDAVIAAQPELVANPVERGTSVELALDMTDVGIVTVRSRSPTPGVPAAGEGIQVRWRDQPTTNIPIVPPDP